MQTLVDTEDIHPLFRSQELHTRQDKTNLNIWSVPFQVVGDNRGPPRIPDRPAADGFEVHERATPGDPSQLEEDLR